MEGVSMSIFSDSVNRKITLADFETRYTNIRKQSLKTKICSVKGCKNPQDTTEFLGTDTCCAYHRILFDHWIYDVIRGNTHDFVSRRGMRFAFAKWRTKTGKETCDEIVLKLAQDLTNWVC
jgi:hypothetical protein